jgi:GTPase SAR1 family protein
MNLGPQLTRVFQSLSEDSLELCFLREPEIVAEAIAEAGEIDLWSPLHAFPIAVMAFLDAGWRPLGGRHFKARTCWETAEIRFAHPDPKEPEIDLFAGGLRWRWFLYRQGPQVAADRKRIGGYQFIDGVTKLLILITRVAVRNALRGERLERACRAWNQAHAEDRKAWHSASRALLGKARQDQIEAIIADKAKPAELSRCAIFIRIAMCRHTPRFELLAKACRRSLRMTSLRKTLCYFVGTDGSGKSTLIDAVYQSDFSEEYRLAHHYWGRSRENSALVRWIRTSVFRIRPGYETLSRERAAGEATPRAKEKNRPGRLYRIFATLSAFLYAFDYWWRFRFELSSATIHLIDRGPLDLLLIRDAFPISRLAAKLSPRGDLIVFCAPPHEIIHDRKQDRTPGMIEFQQTTYATHLHYGRSSLRLNTARPLPSNVTRTTHALHLLARAQSGELDASLYLIIIRQLEAES